MIAATTKPTSAPTVPDFVKAAHLLHQLNGAERAGRGRLIYRTNSNGGMVFGIALVRDNIEGDAIYLAVHHPGMAPVIGGMVRKLNGDEKAYEIGWLLTGQIWHIPNDPGFSTVIVRDTGIPAPAGNKWVQLIGARREGFDEDYYQKCAESPVLQGGDG